jgi:hypothetical protein
MVDVVIWGLRAWGLFYRKKTMVLGKKIADAG